MNQPGEEWPLIGRDDALEASRRGIAQGAGALIVGPAGVGKTSLARVLTRDHQAKGHPTLHLGTTSSISAALRQLTTTPRGDLLVIVDDGHLLDDDAALLVRRLAIQQETPLVITVRTGPSLNASIAALWKDAPIERVDLDDLTQADTHRLLDAVLPGPIGAATRRQLWDLTRGNPLFLRELTRAAIADGSLSCSSGLWKLGEGPKSVRLDEIILARIDRLEPEVREVVELVALGQPVKLAALRAVVGSAPIEAAEDEELIELVLDGRRRALGLVHPLHGEVVERHLGSARKARRCECLLKMIETTPMRRHDDIVRSATWQLQAGGTVVSSDMVLAARRALYGKQEHLAIELASQVLDEGSVDAALVIGEALVELGQPQQAEELLSDTPPANSDAAIALVALQRSVALFWGLGDAAAADEVLEASGRQLPPGAWRDEITAERGVLAAMRGDVTEAWALTEPFLRRTERDRVYATAAIAASCAMVLDGRARQAHTLAQEAYAASNNLADQPVMAEPGTLVVAQAMALAELGDLTEAVELATFGHDFSVTEGNRTGQAWFAIVLARALMLQGHLELAGHLFDEAAAAFAGCCSEGPRRWALAGAVLTAAFRGEADTAQARWKVLSAVPDHPARMWGVEVDRAEAWVHIARQETTLGVKKLRAAGRLAIDAGNVALGAELIHDLVRLGAANRDDDLSMAAGIEGRLGPLRAAHLSATLSRDADALERVGHDFERIGAHLYAAEAYAGAADRFTSRNRPRRANQAARAAETALGLIGEAAPITLRRRVSAPRVTHREHEVALLAVEGLSNREIADHLIVSVRTVENHLQRLYGKLGISGRRELKQAWADQTLLDPV